MTTVLTVYNDDILPYLKYNVASVATWAARHGYSYRLEKIPKDFDRSPHWAKISIGMKVVGDEPLFILDADTIIRHPERNLDPFIRVMREQGKVIGICDDEPNGGKINTGAIILDGNGKLRTLLKEWWELGPQLNLNWDKYHEQDTLVYLMRQKRVNEMVQIFGAREFNSVCDDWKSDEFIAHFMAKSTEEKTRLMRDLSEELDKI